MSTSAGSRLAGGDLFGDAPGRRGQLDPTAVVEGEDEVQVSLSLVSSSAARISSRSSSGTLGSSRSPMKMIRTPSRSSRRGAAAADRC